MGDHLETLGAQAAHGQPSNSAFWNTPPDSATVAAGPGGATARSTTRSATAWWNRAPITPAAHAGADVGHDG